MSLTFGTRRRTSSSARCRVCGGPIEVRGSAFVACAFCGSTNLVTTELARECHRFLDAEQRRQALVLSRALRAAQAAGQDGLDAALAAGRAVLATEPAVEVDYLVVTEIDLDELSAEVPPGTLARVLVAARLGTTRLIDNLPLVIGGAS